MTPSEPSQLEINKIIDLVSKSLYQEALSKANNLIQDYPENSLLFNIAGACNAGLKKFDDAILLYQKAIEIKPDYAKAYYNLAGTFQELGQLDESVKSYKKSLEIEPNYAESYNNLGNVYRELGELEDAVSSYQRAIILNSNYVEAIYSLGIVLHNLNNSDAINCFKKAIKIKPDFAEAYNNLGIALKDSGLVEDAVKSFKKALNLKSNYLEAHNNLGNAYRSLGKFEESIVAYQQAILIKQDYPTTHNNLGNVLKDLGRFEEAVLSYKRAIVNAPEDLEFLNNLGAAYRDCGHFNKAIESYKKALLISPENSAVLNNLGIAFKDIGYYNNAIDSYQKALDINPEYSNAFNNLALVYKKTGKNEKALEAYKKALAINPNDPDTLNNVGITLIDSERLDEAVNCYKKALSINPDYAEAWNNLSIAFMKLKRLNEAYKANEKALSLNTNYAEGYAVQGRIYTEQRQLDKALKSFKRANKYNPDLEYNFGAILNTQMNLCNWKDLTNLLKKLRAKVNNNQRVIVPFDLLGLIDDPKLQKKTSEIYANDNFPESNILPKIKLYKRHSRIRIGYFSADFKMHPVAMLTAELYEIHDRKKFEIHAFSFGPDTHDEMNLRIKAGVDQFHDVHKKSDKDISLLARSLEIDIAIDLGGYTADSRTGIFAMRAAPIQGSYIGVLSTMGSSYYDYLVAGHGMIPKANQKYFSEKIIYLPNYQVNDSKELPPKIKFTRQDLGLPNNGFVFCCLNNNFKITPEIFNIWMRIVKKVSRSVLLIYASTDSVKVNLRKEAIKIGIDPERVIFGENLSRPEYLARYKIADLFLDTHPYNAGTTASDALKMGLPILTLKGSSFNSREAASIINAVNLPEMITTTIEEYESLAIELATNPKKYEFIKKKLVSNLPNAPLFDTVKFTKNLESAFLSIYNRHRKNLEPYHIYIET